MDEEQAIFELLTLSKFKKWSPTTLKTFNNYIDGGCGIEGVVGKNIEN